jgi:hypothetical protein
MSNPTRKDVLAVAKAEVGTKENPAGSNKQKYGKAYGMNGVAWCSEFAWWCTMRPFAWTHEIKTAYCPSWVDWAKKYKYLKSKDYLPKAGDLVLYQMPGPNRVNHIGIVAKDATKKASVGGLYTIEGNTGGSDPRNGGMVASVYRSAATCKAYVKYFVALPYSAEQAAPKATPAKAASPETPAKKAAAKKATFSKYKVKITASVLNVRKSATASSARVKALKKGDVVTVTGEKKGESVKGNTLWLKISSGYIAAEYTKKTK